MRSGAGQYDVPYPIRTWGITTHTTPRHSTRPPHKPKGDANTRTGMPVTLPPFITVPPHPAMPPHHPRRHPHHHYEGGVDEGHPTTRTPQEDTHHPHTAHPTGNSARHDSSTRQHCTGMSRARAAHTEPGRTAAHTTAIQHTTHTKKRRTPSTHLTLFTFIHITINVNQ